MVDMMNTMISDLVPGDTAWHPEFGPGIIYNSIVRGKMCVLYRDALGGISVSANLNGWANVEVVKPGHVQVRVDDLADALIERWGSDDEDSYFAPSCRLAVRAVKAIQTLPVQPDEPTEFGARITLTLKDGARERWLRTGIHNPWQCYLGDGEMIYDHWDELTERGTVSLGWGDES